jgi:phosphoribosylformylglycinamidine synthase
MIKRIYSAKRGEYAVQADKLLRQINSFVGVSATDLKIFIRYDIQGLSEEYYEKAKSLIFSEAPLDCVYDETLPDLPGYKLIAIEILPGQYDQRADSARACLQLLTKGEPAKVRCATVYAISGINDEELNKIKGYLINPVESRPSEEKKPESLASNFPAAEPVKTISGFIDLTEEGLKEYFAREGFAMSFADLKFVQSYFKEEKRNPTVTELKVIDTYWSDHCRHTTFNAKLTKIEIDSDNEHIQKAYDLYRELYEKHNSKRKDKYASLMDIATISIKELSSQGFLDNLDVSDEINACSVEVDVDVNGRIEKWLIMFKNETHNHPTEIEPFGGASTCLGGAIRDPLSGRVYVYQAMRLTGCADPRESLEDTLAGKLPQRVITTKAAEGYSSYGNQIGVASGQVREIYNNRFKAKRMEAGYVIGGAPKENVRREKPKAGDVVILLGGDTGRDGCGGATSSSKAHDDMSMEKCGAEVQKGNPLLERNILRLFRNKKAARLIIKCNDFGAGGVSVAIGELADSLDINLNAVPVKYEGLDGTELAISESQERMAVVVNKDDAEEFIALAAEENLNAVEVAKVTRSGRMRMQWNDEIIVDLKRDFLNTNGVRQEVEAKISEHVDSYMTPEYEEILKVAHKDPKQAILQGLSSLSCCSQKGLAEMFDSTIGASCVLVPYGGVHQLTPAMVMAAKPPVDGETNTVTVSSYGYPVSLLEKSPFCGSVYSVILSINKLIAAGVPLNTIRLTFQEYFMKLGEDKLRWGQPLAALLGALYTQINLNVASIGGKDSMSGSFNELDVPPSLISFAMGIANSEKVISNVFKAGQKIYRIPLERDKDFIPDFKHLKKLYALINANIEMGNVTAAAVVENSPVITLATGLLGEGAGFAFAKVNEDLLKPFYGDFILAIEDIEKFNLINTEYLGVANDTGVLSGGNFEISFSEMVSAYTSTLEEIFPSKAQNPEIETPNLNYIVKETYKSRNLIAKPRVFIPLFPGTNGEYDMERAFSRAGAEVRSLVLKTRSALDIAASLAALKKGIAESEMLAFAGGLSGGGEPDGTAKFIATLFNHAELKEAVLDLLFKRDGLALGIGEGFKALLKLGLLPFGEMREQTPASPTLAPNTIGRHISSVVSLRVASNKGAWLNGLNVGDIYKAPVSHAEGRFVCEEKLLQELIDNGQIAAQYVDLQGNATMQPPYNPNGSTLAIEGLISPDGRIYGKMGHIERIGKDLYKNVQGKFDMRIFESGVKYFK